MASLIQFLWIWTRVVQELPALGDSNDDSVMWLPTSTKKFSASSSREVIREHGNRVEWWRIVWG